MQTPMWIKQQLKNMGLTRVPPDRIITIVNHLKAGKPMYALHRATEGFHAFASQRTVVKIRKLWEARKLDFLIDDQDGMDGHVMDQMATDAGHDREENLEPHPPNSISSQRLKAVFKAEGWMTEGWMWDIGHLRGIGVPEDNALDMLKSYDTLKKAREMANTTRLDFRGFERYVLLHYTVVFRTRYPSAPFQYVKASAGIYTRGVLAGTESLSSAGEDILRYEIWEGCKYRQAYEEALRRYKRTPRAIANLMEQIDQLLEVRRNG
jgi:hypothetical protein